MTSRRFAQVVTVPELFTVPETGKLLKVSASTVYQLIARDALRVVNVAPPGSRKSMSRVRADDLADYIEAQTSSTFGRRTA